MANQRWHFVLAEPFDAAAVERLRGAGEVTVLDAHDEESLKTAVRDCDALLVRTYSKVTRAVLDQASRLKVIGRGGVGLENIDLDAARERGIPVVYTPAAATDAVAELTIGLMIALVRQIMAGDAAVRRGGFEQARRTTCTHELSELTLGVVGLGRIGKAVARRCRHGFGMRVVYNDIIFPGWMDFPATALEKDELYNVSDVVSLHVPLTDETRNLIDATALAGFKPDAVLINTSRGAVVDSDALAHALATDQLAGAALDVFDPEPLPPDHALIKAPNTLFSPHVGARTVDGLARMNDVVEDVIRVLNGLPPLYPAGPHAPVE